MHYLDSKMVLQQLDKNITGNMRRNTRFYRELFFEFCSYFYQMNNKNNIAGFLHLYRILERISYSFPLVWAARATDFEGTFTKLKSYFEAKAELGVFKRFIKDSIDSTYLQTPVQFHIQSLHPDWQKIYFQTITEVLNSIDRNSIVSSTPNSLIETRYDHLVDMTVTIRNKYFHFLSGMNNSFTSDHIITSGAS